MLVKIGLLPVFSCGTSWPWPLSVTFTLSLHTRCVCLPASYLLSEWGCKCGCHCCCVKPSSSSFSTVGSVALSQRLHALLPSSNSYLQLQKDHQDFLSCDSSLLKLLASVGEGWLFTMAQPPQLTVICNVYCHFVFSSVVCHTTFATCFQW